MNPGGRRSLCVVACMKLKLNHRRQYLQAGNTAYGVTRSSYLLIVLLGMAQELSLHLDWLLADEALTVPRGLI